MSEKQQSWNSGHLVASVLCPFEAVNGSFIAVAFMEKLSGEGEDDG